LSSTEFFLQDCVAFLPSPPRPVLIRIVGLHDSSASAVAPFAKAGLRVSIFSFSEEVAPFPLDRRCFLIDHLSLRPSLE